MISRFSVKLDPFARRVTIAIAAISLIATAISIGVVGNSKLRMLILGTGLFALCAPALLRTRYIAVSNEAIEVARPVGAVVLRRSKLIDARRLSVQEQHPIVRFLGSRGY